MYFCTRRGLVEVLRDQEEMVMERAESLEEGGEREESASDMFADTSEEMEDVDYGEEEPSVYSQKTKEIAEEDEKEEEEQPEKTLDINETLRKRWVGDEDELIPESKSEYVGMKPKPTKMMKTKNANVNQSKLIKSIPGFNSTASSPRSSAVQSFSRYHLAACWLDADYSFPGCCG